MNPLEDRLTTGTVGELLLQLRLLEYDIQASSPLKDTGNDLIAIRGQVFKAIQVKTTKGDHFVFDYERLKARKYHLLALIQLNGEESHLKLDACKIFMLPENEVNKGSYSLNELHKFEISSETINNFFSTR